MSLIQSTTNSAQSPTAQPDIDIETNSIQYAKIKDSIAKNTMIARGYLPFKRLCDTLQGATWKAKKKKKFYIVKNTEKALHKKSITVLNGKQYNIKENILKEARILKYLTLNNPPKSLAKYIDFFEDHYNYYLVMEYGGSELFEFMQKAHTLIDNGRLEIKEWLKVCKIIAKQMIEVIEWMHHKMNCVHLDISLENFVIDNVNVKITSSNKIVFVPDFQIKIIDFGLAEVFTKHDNNGGIDFTCSKYAGKALYKSPKIYKKTSKFDARLSDVWSFGVVLFTMVVGFFPYTMPSNEDVLFQCIMSGHLHYMLTKYDKVSFFSVSLYDLITKIFKSENNRINMNQIKNHVWLN